MQTLHALREPGARLRDHLAQVGCEPARVAPLVERLHAELEVTGDRPAFVASAPGRTELGGNHTDHNRGRVLAASVHLDTIAVVAPREDMRVTFASEGFPRASVDLSDLAPRADEQASTAALVRGVASALSDGGRAIGGFDAAVSSRVAAGSGLSSSASVEVLVGAIFNHGWNDDAVGSTEIAVAGRIAENRFFGKPSGLMDQLACASGGVVSIDFAPEDAAIDRIDVTFASGGLALLVVDTGGNHADLTPEYAAIPAEMGGVAAHLGAGVLGEVSERDVLSQIRSLRETLGDRAVARALHFFGENERVARMVSALRDRRFDDYLRLMADSGRSSGMFLQNCAPKGDSSDQSVIVALALTERFFESSGLGNGRGAACRVHGGGFAGTIQVLLPVDASRGYAEFIETYLGAGAVTELHIRSVGAVAW